MKPRYGTMFIWLSFLFCIELFLLAKTDLMVMYQKPWLSVSQLFGLLGVVAYTITFFLSSRLGILEFMFGGLDAVYKTHQRMGRLAFIFVTIHFLSLLFAYANTRSMLMLLLFPSASVAYSAGILAFWSLTFILSLVIFARLEYQTFVRVQTFFILSFSLGFLHSLFIVSDISRYLPLRLYVFSFFGLGLFSFIYRQLLYSILGPRYEYKVSHIKRSKSGWIMLQMSPVSNVMKNVPGQFVYIGFGREGYKKETHPFSIVSTAEDSHLEVWIKQVGDFTKDIYDIQEGQTATVYGPYGTLYEKIFGKERVICVAGGIGVTPFVGMIRQFASQIPSTVFHLFYSVKSRADADELALDTHISSEHSNTRYHLTVTESDRRITGKDIMEIVSHNRKTMYLLCGPVLMMKSIKVQLLEAGVHPRMIFYEEFQY